MDLIITIFAFLILIAIIVAIHEGGHYVAALWCRIKVLEFSLGFGPKIFEKKLGKDNTLFTLRALPLGGFVKPLEKGAIPDEEFEKLSDEDKKRTFANAKKWQKAIMVAGGPLSNFVLAFVIFFLSFTFFGSQGTVAKIDQIMPDTFFAQYSLKKGEIIQEIDGKKIDFANDAFVTLHNAAMIGKKVVIKTDIQTVEVDFKKLDLGQFHENLQELMGIYFQGKLGEINITKVNKDSPSEKAGLKEKDILIAVNKEETQNLSQVLRDIKYSANKELIFTVKRNNELVDLTVIPEAVPNGAFLVGKIGLTFNVEKVTNLITKKYSITEMISMSVEKVISQSYATIMSIKKLITGELSHKAISGPLTIAEYSGKTFQMGIISYLSLMGAISIAVGVFNLLPVPMLDGGHLIQYAIEGVIRKDFTVEQLKVGQYVGIAFMMSLFGFAMINDITRIFF